MTDKTRMEQDSFLPENYQPEAVLVEKQVSQWELGDWLPITWIPATEAELEYMRFCREKTTNQHNKYLENLKLKYATHRFNHSSEGTVPF